MHYVMLVQEVRLVRRWDGGKERRVRIGRGGGGQLLRVRFIWLRCGVELDISWGATTERRFWCAPSS